MMESGMPPFGEAAETPQAVVPALGFSSLMIVSVPRFRSSKLAEFEVLRGV